MKMNNVDYNTTRPSTLEYWFDFECALYKDTSITKEVKLAQAWAVLGACCSLGYVDWDGQRKLFGEFVANLYKLKVRG
jgi:hypothetical protein